MDQAIYNLQKATFPNDANESILQRYQGYFLRILNAKMSHSQMTDETLQSEITRQQTNLPKQKALRFQELLTRLQRQRVIKNRNQILQMLLILGNFKDPMKIDTLFRTSRETNAQSITPQNNSSFVQMKKSLMEIENGLNASIQQDQTIYRKREEQQNPLVKTIKNITDKGNPQIQLREIDLVSDCLYCFQGIEGNYIIYDQQLDSFVLRKDIAISLPTRKLVNQLCEMGWQFKKVQTFLNEQNDQLIIQAIQNGIKEEMNEYYRLIAILENMVQNDAQGKQEQPLTLRKLFLWTRNPQIQMTNLSLLISSNPVSISSIVALNHHGCPITCELFQRLLSASCAPLVRLINRWVFEGVLEGPEFFVEREDQRSTKDPYEQWKREFSLKDERVPAVITKLEAYLIFATGRVVNWIHRYGQFKVTELPLLNVQQLLQKSKQEGSFHEWLVKANELTNFKVINVVFNTLKFEQHLQAIKKYLLLGQGEFIQTLMQIMHAELSKPAVQIYRHNLLGLLESAIRASNVQYSPSDTVLRLDVFLLEQSQGDSGWEVFCLDYRIDQQLQTILNQKAMNNYLRVFNFLWRVKRVEYTLGEAWKLQMKSQSVRQSNNNAFLLCNSLKNQMQHFIQNFYSYVMVEAIEGAWTKFNEALKEAKDLDSIINLHDQFQLEILDGAFLTQKNEVQQIFKLKLQKKGIYRQVLKIFELIFRFKFIQEVLIQQANESLSRIKKDDISVQLRQIVGVGSSNSSINNSKINRNNSDQVKLLKELYQEYKVCINDFQDKLRKDDKLKFLSFRLDFNEYYYNIRNEPHLNMDLDKFVGMYIQNPNPNQQVQQQNNLIAQSFVSQVQQQGAKRAQSGVTPQQRNQIEPIFPIEKNVINTPVLSASALQRTKADQLQPQEKIFTPVLSKTKVEQQQPPQSQSFKTIQEGIKLLDEQQRLRMLQNQNFLKSQLQKTKMDEEKVSAPTTKSDFFQVIRKDHEKMKNDEEDLKNSSDDFEYAPNQDDDDEDDL